MQFGARVLERAWVEARVLIALAFLFFALAGAAGCGITTSEPLYGNYNRSDATRLQRRSDVRACERGHQRAATGPANRKAALTNLRVEQCLELRGYRRQPTSR